MEIENAKKVLDKYGESAMNERCLRTLIDSFEKEPRDYITIELDGYTFDIYWGTPEGDMLRRFIENLHTEFAHTVFETEKRVGDWK